MNRELSDVIIAVTAVFTLTAGGIVAYWMSLRAGREQRRETIADPEGLQVQIDDLRAELGAQIAELQERVDFTERLLANQSGTPLHPLKPVVDENTPREL